MVSSEGGNMKSITWFFGTTAMVLGLACVIPGGSAGAFDFDLDYWPTSKHTIIKHELSQYMSWGRATTEYDLYGYWGQVIGSEKADLDTLNIGLGYRYYFNSRFNHPGLPYAFVPYNYRSNYFEVSGNIGDFNSKINFDIDGDSQENKYGSGTKSLSTTYIYHHKKVFHGLSGAFYRETDDESFDEDYQIERKLIGANLGLYTIKFKYGVLGQWQDVSGFRKVGASFHQEINGTFIRIMPYLEETFSPYLMVAGAFDYGWRSDAGEYKYYRIPLLCSYLNYDVMCEFNVSGEYITRDYGDDYIFSISKTYNLIIKGSARKFLNDISIIGGFTYENFRIKDYEGSESMVTLSAGGDITINRRITFSLSLWYGTGNNNIEWKGDLARYGLATGIRGNF